MSTPVLPTIIRGPVAIVFNGYTYYFKDGVSVKPSRAVFEVTSDFWGYLDSRMESLMVEIEGTPVGMLNNAIKYYPYGPSSLVAASSVGTSIFTGSDLPLVLATQAGLTTTFSRGGIAGSPILYLSPRKTAYGSIKFRAIGKRATQPTSATWLKAIASASFTDTTFDDSKIKTDIYSAALGSRSTPYNAMGARTGFEIEPVYGLEEVQDDGVGIADVTLTDVRWKVRFAPNNLTETQVDALAMWQDTSGIIAGQSLSRGPVTTAESLVISADALTATLAAVGVVSSEHGFGVKVDRNGMIEFVTRQTFTTGAPNPLFSITIN